MDQLSRWLAAGLISIATVAATWLTCQYVFGLPLEISIAVASLTAAVLLPLLPAVSVRERTSATTRTSATAPAESVWNIPIRNQVFTGRDDVLASLRAQLASSGRAAILALHGIGGVGKTSVAVEYAHRFAEEYDIAWWINSEEPGLIRDQLSALGAEAGWLTSVSDMDWAVREVLRRLRAAERWLVIFDNVGEPDDVVPYLPQGRGHVLLTSRNPAWRQIAEPVEIDVFSRGESVSLLKELAKEIGTDDATRIAEEVGDLPLAVAQAAGTIAETGMSAAEYLQELTTRAAWTLSSGKPVAYPATMDTLVTVAVNRLETEDRQALDLLRICAFLAPVPIPTEIIGPVATSNLRLRQMIGRLSRYGLVKADPTGPQLHRLTRAVIIDQLDPAEREVIRRTVMSLLVQAAPSDEKDPSHWPSWGRCLPHLLAFHNVGTDLPELRPVLLQAGRYLHQRGEWKVALTVARGLYRSWSDELGADDPLTLGAAHQVATSYVFLGEYPASINLIQETLARRREVLGPSHSDTLNSANILGLNLLLSGRAEEARVIHEDTLQRAEAAQPHDTDRTLGMAHNLALDLHTLGRYAESLRLNQDVYARRARLLGDNHPHTLMSGRDLAQDYFENGRVEEALSLGDDILERYRRVLGMEHPATLKAAVALAELMHRAGRVKAAAALHADTLARLTKVLGEEHPATKAARQLGGLPRGVSAESGLRGWI